MDELHRAADKLDRAARDLDAAVAKLDPDDERSIRLTLGVAKRVRRDSNLLVRAIARIRDDLHTQEGDNKS